MASLTLKNIPDDLLDRLRGRAARNRRSLSGEILTLLDAALPRPLDPALFAAEVREMRHRYGLTGAGPEEVDLWKRTGREGEE